MTALFRSPILAMIAGTNPVPIISSVTPDVGTDAGGTPIAITGDHFTVASGVTVAGVAATSVVVVDEHTITCVTPTGSDGDAAIAITTPNGTGSAAGVFAYQAPPTVTAITPSHGVDTGGTPITDLAGTGFQVGSTVTIGGASATSVVFVSSTKLTCVAPAGVDGAADVVVSNPGPVSSGVSGAGLYTFDPVLDPAAWNLSKWFRATFSATSTAGTPSTGISGAGGTNPMTVSAGSPTRGPAVNGLLPIQLHASHPDRMDSDGGCPLSGYTRVIVVMLSNPIAPTPEAPTANPSVGINPNAIGDVNVGRLEWSTSGVRYLFRGFDVSVGSWYMTTPWVPCGGDTWHQIDITNDGTDTKLRIDGGSWHLGYFTSDGTQHTGGSIGPSALVDPIGYTGSTSAIDEQILEIVVAPSVLSDADLDAFRTNYVLSRYGLAL